MTDMVLPIASLLKTVKVLQGLKIEMNVSVSHNKSGGMFASQAEVLLCGLNRNQEGTCR